jgi:hypothetical protein
MAYMEICGNIIRETELEPSKFLLLSPPLAKVSTEFLTALSGDCRLSPQCLAVIAWEAVQLPMQSHQFIKT